MLSGEVQFSCDGEAHVCAPGTLVHIPRGTVHGFQYGKGGGQMLEVTGKNALAAQMFTAVDQSIPPGTPDIPSCCRFSGKTGSLSPVRPKGARMERHIEVVLLAQNAKCGPSRESLLLGADRT